MVKRLLCCVLLALGALGQGAPDAATRFAQLRRDAKDAREKKDQKALLAVMLEMAQLLRYSGPSAERLALTYGEMGDQKQALQALGDFVAMGQSDDDLMAAPQLQSLKGAPEFERLAKQMEGNRSPVQRGVAVTDFQDPNLVPEDIDYDPQTRSFLVTSVLEKKIVRISLDGTQKDFAVAPDGWPMMAIKIDRQRGWVWATEVALDKFVAAPEKDWGRSAVLCLRLADGKVIRRIEGPAHSALGDMALTPAGDVIVADGAGGGVYRIRATPDKPEKSDAMERLDGGDFISPQTPALDPDGRRVFVPDYARGVGVLDLTTKEVRWIETNRRHALQGIDGLYFHRGTLIAVQNGSSPERVVSFHIDPEFKQVVSEEVTERSTPTLGDPTHGVVVGESFYYIANSGWDSLDDDGKLKPNAKMTVAHIMKAELKER
jgi:hypothetical protein